MEDEIDVLNKKVSDLIQTKVERKEIRNLWQYFDRFAEYTDLKELHAIVIPEIAKFEAKIIVYQTKLD